MSNTGGEQLKQNVETTEDAKESAEFADTSNEATEEMAGYYREKGTEHVAKNDQTLQAQLKVVLG